MCVFPYIVYIPYCRQAEFLGEIAILEAPLTGIQFWYIGLTDLSKLKYNFVYCS